ncbi:OB-fold protein [Spongiimicrobium salis]|uniref:OB-fold protein n=1 Tax=Spongiimicrobium salis TaxID=1667022 RepID=UPI00374DCE83
MNAKLKIFIVGFLLLLLLGGSYLYFEYTKPPMDIENVKTEVEVSSKNLAAMFHMDKDRANSTFVEKTIEVEGIIDKIIFKNDHYSVFLQAQEKGSKIICAMKPSKSDRIKNLKPGENVRLKGICKGYLSDVIMLNCILANK